MNGMFAGIDHVGIVVRNVDDALPYWRDTLGLRVTGDELAEEPGVRLVYLDAGTTSIQLVEPVRDHSTLHAWLDRRGEGLHHVCFVTPDLEALAAAVPGGAGPLFRAGRRRRACFLEEEPNGVTIEVTERSPSF